MPAAATLSGQLIGGPVGNWLAIVGVVSLLYWAWRIVMALQNRGVVAQQGDPKPAPIPQAAPIAMEDDDDLVVIAAAAYAITIGGRVVQIAPASPNQSWASEGRWAQQNSHSPR